MDILPGLIHLNTPENKIASQRTIIVLGEARGGTSLAAGILSALGVPMGTQVDDPIFEDGVLTRAIRSGRTKNFRNVITQYNALWNIWGFKQPSAKRFLMRKASSLRNPMFLMIVKDAVSICSRKNDLYGYDYVQTMRSVLKSYDEQIRFLSKKRYPALVISYEKLVSNPAPFLDHICSFFGLDTQKIPHAIAFMSKGNSDYEGFFTRQKKRKDSQIEGHIDNVSEDEVSGWALLQGACSPIEIKVFLNNTYLGSVFTDKPRQDVADQYGGEYVKSGYTFKFPSDYSMTHGDVLSVFAGPAQIELSRSPWVW